MGWADYSPPTADIPLGVTATGEKNSGKVRGLSIEIVGRILDGHLGEVIEALQVFREQAGSGLSLEARDRFLALLPRRFPSLASALIRESIAGEPPPGELNLGLGVELYALREIWRLTLEEVGGLGNLFGPDMTLEMETAISALTPAPTPTPNEPSPDSTGEAASPPPDAPPPDSREQPNGR